MSEAVNEFACHRFLQYTYGQNTGMLAEAAGLPTHRTPRWLRRWLVPTCTTDFSPVLPISSRAGLHAEPVTVSHLHFAVALGNYEAMLPRIGCYWQVYKRALCECRLQRNRGWRIHCQHD